MIFSFAYNISKSRIRTWTKRPRFGLTKVVQKTWKILESFAVISSAGCSLIHVLLCIDSTMLSMGNTRHLSIYQVFAMNIPTAFNRGFGCIPGAGDNHTLPGTRRTTGSLWLCRLCLTLQGMKIPRSPHWSFRSFIAIFLFSHSLWCFQSLPRKFLPSNNCKNGSFSKWKP